VAGWASFFVYSSFLVRNVDRFRWICKRLTSMCTELSDMCPKLSDMYGDFKLNIPELCAASGFFQRGNVLREMPDFLEKLKRISADIPSRVTFYTEMPDVLKTE